MKIHLIGICGTGMGSLAGLLKAAGHDVRGSDSDVYPPMSTQLAAQDIAVMNGYRADNLDWAPDVVVVGNVCTKDHVEVLAAQARDLKLTSFPALLEDLFLRSGKSVVVAGTHGKTTTSSLLAHVLTAAGRDPSFLIGGVPQNFQRGWRLGAPTSPFIVEGDEYDTAFFDKGSKFLHYQPKIAILTSVELDHVDIFDSFDAVKEAFAKFVALIPPDGLLVVAADAPGALEVARGARCRVQTYLATTQTSAARGAGADWVALPISSRGGGRTVFDVAHGGVHFGTFDFGLPGQYNLANALAVIAACADLGLDADQIAGGIRRFAGVKRRQETRGVAQGVTVVDDFAHHPTAVRETLKALRGRYGNGRVLAVFEPRSATSRRATFQHDYVDAFAGADEVIIGGVNHPEKAPAGDRFDPERLAADLRARGSAARYMPDVGRIVEHLATNAAAGDTVVVLSSGSFEGLHDRLLTRLGDAVVPAGPEDLDGIRELLAETSLGYPDLAEHLHELLVLRDAARRVVGCVALEMHGDAGLLRALVTSTDRRGEGLGWMLADAALGRARRRGARRVYLVTEHATDFFAEKFGFRTVARQLVDSEVLESSQFRASSKDATTMVLDLDAP